MKSSWIKVKQGKEILKISPTQRCQPVTVQNATAPQSQSHNRYNLPNLNYKL